MLVAPTPIYGAGHAQAITKASPCLIMGRGEKQAFSYLSL